MLVRDEAAVPNVEDGSRNVKCERRAVLMQMRSGRAQSDGAHVYLPCY